MTKLNYGLIGCGMMGQEHIKNIQLLEDAEIAAIYEPDSAMCKAALELVPKALTTGSVEALLEIDQLDCLVITSPNFTHVGHLQTLLDKRPMPVLVEKPLATSHEDLSALRRIKAEYLPPIWVAMEYRYMPPLAEFIKLADEVTGGITMLSIREHRFPFLEKVNDWNRFDRYSGGTLVEKCCHFFDLMRFILDSEAVSVMASAGQSHNHLDEKCAGETPDIIDNAYTIVDFESGSRAMLELCMFAEGSFYQEEICAVGKDGKIECLIPGPQRFWSDELGPPPEPKIIISPRHAKREKREIEIPVDPLLQSVGDHHGSTYYQHQRFQQVVLGKETPEVTLEDGWKAVLIGMSAQQSAQSFSAQKIEQSMFL